MKISILIVMFLLIGAFFIISNNKLKLIENSDAADFANQYVRWLGSITNNTAGSVGYVIKMDWLPDKKIENKEVAEDSKENS